MIHRPPPLFLTRKERKKRKKNKNKDSEVRSHSLEASATEKSAPSRSRGKRYVLPKFSVILLFNSLMLLFTKLHLCNTSSNNNYSMDSSAEERSARNASSGDSQMTRKKRGRPLKDTTQ